MLEDSIVKKAAAAKLL
jgi:hypothetical protein